MKKIIGIILTLIAVNSFAEKIPEAKKLHPDLYTIQFTYARYPTSDNVKMSEKEFKHAHEDFDILLEDLDYEEEFEGVGREKARALLYGRVIHKALLNHIESSKDVEYKDLATIYTSSGEPFPEAYSKVKGLLDVESNTIVLSEFNFSEYYVFVDSLIPILYINDWHALGGHTINGYILIKCYPPTNVSSNQKLDPSAVKTSGDLVNEQGTAAEL